MIQRYKRYKIYSLQKTVYINKFTNNTWWHREKYRKNTYLDIEMFRHRLEEHFKKVFLAEVISPNDLAQMGTKNKIMICPNYLRLATFITLCQRPQRYEDIVYKDIKQIITTTHITMYITNLHKVGGGCASDEFEMHFGVSPGT